MKHVVILTALFLALAATGLWLIELTNYEATKRNLRDVEELNRGLAWVNGLQALEIRLLKSEQEIGRSLFGQKGAVREREAESH